MIYNEEEHNFDKFIKKWNKDEEYLLFGKSKECFQFIKSMNYLLGENELKIFGIMDFEQKNITIEESLSSIFKNYYNASSNKEPVIDNKRITLFPVEELKNLKNLKIIVTTDYYRLEVIEYLHKQKFKENIDYCIYKNISGIWPLKYKNIVHLSRIDQTLTSKCSLNCTFCNMYIPHYDKQSHLESDYLIKDIDLLFTKVDYISTYQLIGGEPFLYPKIDYILEYIGVNYRNKIDNLTITTNGTIPIKDTTLVLLKQYDIYLSVSDYRDSLPQIKEKVTELISSLEKSNIYYNVREANEWSDFGDPRIEIRKNSDDVIKHFDKCTAPFRGISGNKFYYCNLSMSADAAGVHPIESSDYLDLTKINSKEELIKFDLGFIDIGYITLCKSCNGCNTGINIQVSPKSQYVRKLENK